MDFRQIGAAQTSHPWHRVIACANRHKIEELLKTRRCVFCGNPGFSAKKIPHFRRAQFAKEMREFEKSVFHSPGLATTVDGAGSAPGLP